MTTLSASSPAIQSSPSTLRWFTIADDVAIRQRSDATAPVIPTDVQAEVDRRWAEEVSRRPGLFNGQMFSLDQPIPNPPNIITSLSGHFVDYKYFLAQRSNPALYAELQICPLAITGCIRLGDGILLGQRAAHVTQDPLKWELLPSGGISPVAKNPDGTIDYQRQLTEEFEEETSLLPDYLTDIRLQFLVEDTHEHVYDLVISATLTIDPPRVMSALNTLLTATGTTHEYTQFKRLTAADWPTFAETEPISPLTRTVLEKLF